MYHRKDGNIEFNLNFGGFYDSEDSSNIEREITSYFDVDDYCDINDKDLNAIDFKAMQKNYAKEWLSEYLKIIDNNNDLNIKFKEIVSPEYYNYETDTIGVLINESKANHLIIEASDDLIEYINKNSQYHRCHRVIGYDIYRDTSVFMTYYTDYLTQLNKDSINDLWPSIALKSSTLCNRYLNENKYLNENREGKK